MMLTRIATRVEASGFPVDAPKPHAQKVPASFGHQTRGSICLELGFSLVFSRIP